MNILEYKLSPINSVMYIIVENKYALIIDPCINSDAEQILCDSGVDKVLIILTHEHCDHISGVNRFKEIFDTEVWCSYKCAANIQNPHKNLSQYVGILVEEFKGYNVEPFSCAADRCFEGEINMQWNGHSVYLKEIPGHSEGSICILLDETYAFTGDYLIEGKKVFTKLPGGSKKEYLKITKPYLDSIKDNYIICPGHKE